MPSAAVARKLVVQANVARDAQRFQAASALFEQASRFAPANARIHKQCGHMFKEAGDFISAERHYLRAAALDPADADLALQMGHFYKVARRPEDAVAAYQRALVLKPGWTDAVDELVRTRSMSEDGAGATGTDNFLISAFLPGGDEAQPVSYHDTVRIYRLGTARIKSGRGYQRALRGIEAIRGYCISTAPLVEILMILDGDIIHREDANALRLGTNTAQAKYVFNIWYDFSRFSAGNHTIELRFLDAKGRRRAHRTEILIASPLSEAEFPASDAVVTLPGNDDRDIEIQINERRSVVRAADRRLLAPPRNILVQRVDQLGDLVCSVPALRRLRAMFPDARIVGLVTPANAELAATMGLFDEVVIADFSTNPGDRHRVMSVAAQNALRAKLLALDLDMAIDLGEGAESRPLLLLSGAPFLYGFKDREFPWLSAGFEMNSRDPVNQLEISAPSRKLLALVESLGALIESSAIPLRRDDLDRSVLAPLGIGANDKFVVLHMGARLAYSRWPYFRELAGHLLEKTDFVIVIMSDEEGYGAGEVLPDRLRIVSGRLPFNQFDALLSFCSVLVGNDSGPKHLASLRGTKVVSLHMARLNWNEWGQEMTGAIISRRVPCAGCAISSEPEECGKGFPCLRMITADEVFGSVINLLQ